MKKFLFATTALGAAGLIVSADMAKAQEVSIGGYGRFGLGYLENNTPGADETRVIQRLRFTVTGTTTTDNGVEFEGRIRFQTDENAAGASNVAQRSAAGFAVSTGAWRLDVGHVSDVVDSGDVLDFFGYEIGVEDFIGNSTGAAGIPASGFGTSGDDDTIAPTVKLRYTAGDLTASISYTDDVVATNNAAGGNEFQIGVGYNFGNYSIGAAYGSSEDGVAPGSDNDFYVIGFGGELGAFAFNALVYDSDVQDDVGFSLTAKYDIGAATDIRFVYADGGIDTQEEAYGIGFRHNLGGGVVLRGGIGQTTADLTQADLGVRFDF
ncbi:porin [Tateyamaria sp. syn59]|uniref:porin n=1 Tax=Tateyamaria sp. syn59 TaxID=2576942 RepID=UPI0011BFB322|nr:porin [Tateyamaria sp. syn59]